MTHKRTIIVAALLVPLLVLGGCGKRGVLKRVNEHGGQGVSRMPAAHGAARTQSTAPVTPSVTAPVRPGEVLPDPNPFENRQ